VSTVKQVAGHAPGGLLAQEHLPAAGRPPWRRVQPVTAKRRSDRSGRDVHTKPLQLALDPLIAPARIFPGQPDDQLLYIWVQRRPPGLAVRVGPCAGDQPPVPAQQRVGLHEKARPAFSGQRAAEGGEQGPVGGLQPGTWGVPTQGGELVAQDEDLQVLAGVAAAEQGEHLNGAAQREGGEFRQHQGDLAVGWLKRHATEPRPARTGSSQLTSEFAYSTRRERGLRPASPSTRSSCDGCMCCSLSNTTPAGST
jgi:hypothetical protein